LQVASETQSLFELHGASISAFPPEGGAQDMLTQLKLAQSEFCEQNAPSFASPWPTKVPPMLLVQ
jgi:hypothetical protein